MGRTYIHLGAVYITGFKDRQKGLQSFQRALEIDPTIQLSKGIETAEVTATFAEAQRNARSGGGSASGGGGGDENAPPTKKKRRGPVMEGDAGSDDHPKAKKHRPAATRSPICPRTSARSTARSRTRRSSTSRSPFAAWWPRTCRWPPSI